jgi:hypothetical protein
MKRIKSSVYPDGLRNEDHIEVANASADTSVEVKQLDELELLPGEEFADKEALARCLFPLLLKLKVLGAYFDRDSSRGKIQRNYCRVCLVFLLLNVARLSTVFTRGDSFGSELIIKMAMMLMLVISALQHSAYYYASQSGLLNEVIKETRFSPECIRYLRKYVIGHTALGCACFVIYYSFFGYDFFSTGGYFDFLLAPFVTHIPLEAGYHVFVKSVYMACLYSTMPLWFLTEAMSHIVTLIFYRQFKLLNDRFQLAIDHSGKFRGNLRAFRRRHHMICLATTHADSFLMFVNVSAFLCHGCVILIIMFVLLFCDVDAVPVKVGFAFLMIGNVFALALTMADGTLVNHVVRILECILNDRLLLHINSYILTCVSILLLICNNCYKKCLSS